MKKTGSTSDLFGLKLFSSQKQVLLAFLENDLKSGEKPIILFTPNPEQVVQAREYPQLSNYFNQADYLIPDGVGLVLASKLLASRGKVEPISERISGVDVTTDLLKIARREHWRVLIVGGRLYTPAESLTYQDMRLYWTEGYQDVRQPLEEEEKKLENLITSLKPDIVFVAFGAPWQEQWVIEHLPLLQKAGTRLVMAVGGSFDYLFGKVARAPRWVRQLSMEWLYRLVRQPWRWRRQLRLVKFIRLVIKDFFK